MIPIITIYAGNCLLGFLLVIGQLEKYLLDFHHYVCRCFLPIHIYQLVMLYQADQIVMVSRCGVFNGIYHSFYNHYKYIEICGLTFPLTIMYSCMRYLVNKGCAYRLKKSSHNSKFQRGLCKGKLADARSSVTPRQCCAYIVQNYDTSINQNPGFVCQVKVLNGRTTVASEWQFHTVMCTNRQMVSLRLIFFWKGSENSQIKSRSNNK